MPKFTGGASSVKKAAQSGGGGGTRREFTPFFRLKAEESEFVQFLTGFNDDEPYLLEFHRFVKVKFKGDDGKVESSFRDFLRRQPGVFDDGQVLEDGTDLWDDVLRNQIGHVPQENHCGLVAILEPQYEGASKRNKDIESLVVQGRWYVPQEGEPIFYPSVQLVFQSARNFWQVLQSYNDEEEDVTQTPIKAVRTGSGQNDTAYNFFGIDAPVYLPEVIENQSDDDELVPSDIEIKDWYNDVPNLPTMLELLEGLGSNERYEKFFGDEDLWVMDQDQKYVNKNEKGDKGGSKKSAARRKSEDSSEEEESSAETRFSRLRRSASQAD